MSNKEITWMFDQGFNDNGFTVLLIDTPGLGGDVNAWVILRKSGLAKFIAALEAKNLTQFTFAWSTDSNFIIPAGMPKRGLIGDDLKNIFYLDAGDKKPQAGITGKSLADSASFAAMAGKLDLTRLKGFLEKPKVADKLSDLGSNSGRNGIKS